jgi:hypothetical protein
MKSSIYKNINYRFFIINVPNVLNILIPIFLLPIVISSAGMAEFGKLIYYQGIIGILLLISENGLNTITLSIINRINLNTIVYHVILVKLLIALALYGVTFFFIPFSDVFFFFVLYSSVFGQAINVSYLFIFNRSETKYSLILMGLKLISLLIYLGFFQQGVFGYALFLSTSDVLIGLLSVIFSGHFQNIFSTRIDLNTVKYLWKRGFNFTKINLLSSGYTQVVPIYLKFFFGFEIIGIYGAIEKVFRGFCNISAPFNLILLRESNFISIRSFFELKQVRLFFALFLLSLFFVGLFSEFIMAYLIADVDFDTYKLSFLISLLIPIVVFFSRTLVINFYVKNSLEDNLYFIYLYTLLISIPLNIFSIYFFGLFGCIFSALIIEVFCLYKLKLKLRTII